YNKMLRSHQSWTSSNKKWISSPIRTISSSDFTKPSDYHSIPITIRSYLEDGNKYQKQVRFKLKGKEYNIFLLKPVQDFNNANMRKTESFFEQALMKMYMWLDIIHSYARVGCSDEMSVHIYFTDHKKSVSNGPNIVPLGEMHVNTAFTTSCMPSTNTIIYREEEWFKVFIHETFHNLGLDFSSFDMTETNKRVLDLYPISSPPGGVRLYESYCEMWAEMLHTLFFAFWKTREKTNEELILTKFEKMFKLEVQFSVFQCVKILDYYGLTYAELIKTNCEMSKKARKKYSEKSHILSYYVVKAALITQPNAFLEWCINNTRNGIAFIHTQEHINDYTRLVEHTYMNSLLLHYVQEIEKWFKKNKRKSMVCTNLRMTLFG
ncbi:MAG: hypothetical protein HQ505_09270, partial [Nitrosopumilus sp.]|nr:hypothetical protein [Nitrosopumilus sp.]